MKRLVPRSSAKPSGSGEPRLFCIPRLSEWRSTDELPWHVDRKGNPVSRYASLQNKNEEKEEGAKRTRAEKNRGARRNNKEWRRGGRGDSWAGKNRPERKLCFAQRRDVEKGEKRGRNTTKRKGRRKEKNKGGEKWSNESVIIGGYPSTVLDLSVLDPCVESGRGVAFTSPETVEFKETILKRSCFLLVGVRFTNVSSPFSDPPPPPVLRRFSESRFKWIYAAVYIP
ncbi:hypothetical protein K0M31_013263 [Melipona bicolor]|uniref:Uncharacterized protein n=1 Tax=Melipona bicolor TaxID=60889 RepID=A0AA40KGF3_9HYME|nr:hypothetical protein K0M31_013263 [Melipona bicolor]